MIAIVDYGIGNLRSVWKAFHHLGADARLTREPQTVMEADRIVLPGVGAFGDCMANLDRLGLIEPLKEVIGRGTPYLGICLGLQILFTESTEFGRCRGLGILEGTVERFPFGDHRSHPGNGPSLKVPHMGWNDVRICRKATLLEGIPTGSYFYFVHSYYVRPRESSVVATTTEYGIGFASSVWRENLFACQFHPEKSQVVGLRLLENFLHLSLNPPWP